MDLDIANAICGLGATAMHITNDIRHLASMKELEEPFEKDQIGSSAMAYKRNPMRSERICSLGRKLRSLPVNFADTYSDQWFERTLDDSAIRRIDIPEMMLLADAILIGLNNVSSGLVSKIKFIVFVFHFSLGDLSFIFQDYASKDSSTSQRLTFTRSYTRRESTLISWRSFPSWPRKTSL